MPGKNILPPTLAMLRAGAQLPTRDATDVDVILPPMPVEKPAPKPKPTPVKKVEQVAPKPKAISAPKGEVGDLSAYDSYIEASAKKHKVDPDLVRAMIWKESTGNPNAGSKAGAQGLMQLMPLIQKHYGVTDPTDPAQNIEGGVRLLADYMKKFGGNLDHALAAYNKGETAVRRSLRETGALPTNTETANYIPMVKGYMEKYQAKRGIKKL